MDHKIKPETLNSAVDYCIDEYVRLERDRAILRDHWWRGVPFLALAERYDVTLTTIKRVIYDIGDPILLRAEQMSRSK